MKKWDAAADEARFQEDIRLGHKWVEWTARQLEYQGIVAVVPPMQIRGEFGERRQFRDHGDLFVRDCRIEVRSLASTFRSPATWPYRTVRVDLVDVFEAKKDTGIFLYVSRPTRSIIGLRLRRGAWSIQAGIYDERRKVRRDWVVVDRKFLVTWEQAVQYLHERQAGC